MINIFLNEESGYRHLWWEYPGTLDDLVMDWNSGNAPFMGKPYQGTLTELPTEFDPDNPFAATMAGRMGTYTMRRPGEDPEEKACNSMDDFFQAYAEVDVPDSYLRIGDEYFPYTGDLLPEEQEVADNFNWADWTEDPAYYYQWFEDWKSNYRCGQDRTDEIEKFYEGRISPQRSTEVANHINVCQDCKARYIALRSRHGGRWVD
jgi:hypothetical protein